MNTNGNTPFEMKTIDPFGKSDGKNATLAVTEDSSVQIKSETTAQNDTTAFVDDGNVVIRDESHVAHIDDTIMKLNDTNIDEQSIVSFLSRPILFVQGNFSITDTYSSLFNNYSMPYSVLTSTQAVMWREKLAGIYGIKMDMRFRIVVNANRFQQGRYIMGWVPLAGNKRTVSSLKELAHVQSHMATLVQRTTVPHVEIDLSTDTTAELLVPYVSARTFYPLNSVLSSTNEYPLGYLNVYPYSPLVSPAGSTVAGYSIYVSFEKVRLFGAASAQSGISSHRNVQLAELSNKSNGPVSSVSSALSRGFKEFAHIPVLSSYANSISWVADRVTQVASVFGWSKPTQGDSLTKMQINVASNHNTVDGDSDARALSFLSKPGVVALDGVSGTDLDEMDFSYIARKPAWFATSAWITGFAAGSLIATIPVYPYHQYTVGGAVHYQPVAFVASFFKAWRGSLRYRIKFVKTEFHSGRVSIAFFPSDSITALSGNAAYVHRMIVDIRMNSEVDFIIPFISNSIWSTANTGSFVVSVVDPLVAPDTVSSSINLLFEVCAGEDFEVAIPAEQNYITPVLFTPQSGLTNENRLTTMNIGNSTIAADPNISSSTTIGDKISSFRSLLKRYTPVRKNDITSSPLNIGTLTFRPDAIFAQGNLTDLNYFQADAYSLVASCYAIARGGVRVRDVVNRNMLTNGSNWGPSMVKVSTVSETTTGLDTTCLAVGSNSLTVNGNSHVQFQDLKYNSVISLEVPQYTYTLAKSVVDIINYQGSAYGYAIGPLTSSTQIYFRVGIPQSSSVGITARPGQEVHNVFRSLADDGNFGCFISVPAMRVSPAFTDPVTCLY